MITCKSPRTVMRAAYELAQQYLSDYTHRFSRHDFTIPQLFACLVLREHQKKSYRGTEELLRDCADLRDAVDLTRAPDHNTLCRAFTLLTKPAKMNRALDLQVEMAKAQGLQIKGDSVKPAVLDGTCFESRHVSRHFERRQRQTAKQRRKTKGATRAKQAKTARAQRADAERAKAKAAGDRRRSRTVKRLPRLSIAIAASCHLILAARATTGMGSDHPHFEPLLFDAWRRADVRVVAGDAGYDSEANHEIARRDMGIRSIIPPDIGRPSDKSPPTRYRRLMRQRFDRGADKATYGQRWQVETVNSMIKRNLGSALRATTARRRSRELLLRCITHNIMVLEGTEP